MIKKASRDECGDWRYLFNDGYAIGYIKRLIMAAKKTDKKVSDAQLQKKYDAYKSLRTIQKRQSIAVDAAERNYQKAKNIRDAKLETWKKTNEKVRKFENDCKSKGIWQEIERRWSKYINTSEFY
ncbi:MAG: hypothetical protein PHR89_04870 [Bacilli bacterium]|nr:hypothetical protein [Bacilli bacterium]